MSSARWYVVQTQPHAEAKANEHLRRQGFITYLPRLRKQRRHARKTEAVSRPLFPRYMFVRIDTSCQSWHVIRSTFGVTSLIGGENGPTPMREGVIEALRAQEGADGFFRTQLKRFVAGEAIRVVDGLFTSAVGFFENMNGHERVSVLLDILGGRRRVTLDLESVAAA